MFNRIAWLLWKIFKWRRRYRVSTPRTGERVIGLWPSDPKPKPFRTLLDLSKLRPEARDV